MKDNPLDVPVTSSIRGITTWRGRLLELGLPCPCGRNDAARALGTDGIEVIICKASFEAHSLRPIVGDAYDSPQPIASPHASPVTVEAGSVPPGFRRVQKQRKERE